MTSTNATSLNRLEMTSITKSYGSVKALRGVNFAVRPGEVMALLGENGAGKSTLVKMLAGLVQPDGGRIVIEGREVSIKSNAHSRDLGIAVVQQEYSSVPNLSVAENIFLGSSARRSIGSVRSLNKAAAPLLATVGLADLDPQTLVENLGVAERQLVEIARVLTRNAEILLFDEPTAALSDKEIDRILRVVQDLAAEGRSIIYVTHRLAEVFLIADRVTVVRDGVSLAPEATSDLDVDSLITMMLGRGLGALFPDRPDTAGDPVVAETLLEFEGVLCEGIAEPVDLRVRRGQIVGLTGQLGSGADAVVQVAAGVRRSSAGTVIVSGRPLTKGTRSEGIAARVAYCSADRKSDGIFSRSTIRQNLSSPWLSRISRFGVLKSKRENVLAQRAAREFAINVERLESPVGTLSGGNQQKVALGKWIGGDPVVLLVEEPTRGVDVGARAEIYQRLRSLCDAGTAIVVTSSDTAEILGISDVIATFYRGRLIECRPREHWTAATLAKSVLHGSLHSTEGR